MNKKGFPVMGTYQPSPMVLLRTNNRISLPLLQDQETIPGEEEKPCYLNYLKRPQVEAGWERISGQVMPMSWGEQASILPLFSLGKLFPSFQRERQSPVNLPRKGPAARCQSSRKHQADHARLLMGFSPTSSREEGSQVENNPNALSTSLERALITDSTISKLLMDAN